MLSLDTDLPSLTLQQVVRAACGSVRCLSWPQVCTYDRDTADSSRTQATNGGRWLLFFPLNKILLCELSVCFGIFWSITYQTRWNYTFLWFYSDIWWVWALTNPFFQVYANEITEDLVMSRGSHLRRSFYWTSNLPVLYFERMRSQFYHIRTSICWGCKTKRRYYNKSRHPFPMFSTHFCKLRAEMYPIKSLHIDLLRNNLGY